MDRLTMLKARFCFSISKRVACHAAIDQRPHAPSDQPTHTQAQRGAPASHGQEEGQGAQGQGRRRQEAPAGSDGPKEVGALAAEASEMIDAMDAAGPLSTEQKQALLDKAAAAMEGVLQSIFGDEEDSDDARGTNRAALIYKSAVDNLLEEGLVSQEVYEDMMAATDETAPVEPAEVEEFISAVRKSAADGVPLSEELRAAFLSIGRRMVNADEMSAQQ